MKGESEGMEKGRQRDRLDHMREPVLEAASFPNPKV